MKNFKFSAKTDIFFGKGEIKVLGNQLKKNGAKNILLTYGKNSIKKSGLYDNVIEILKEKNINFFELSGIDPNPRITSVRAGIKICKENNIDFILAVGAGSVIDCSKAIASGSLYDGDPWDFAIGKAHAKKALPVACILTLAATGSEMNSGAVITNDDTKEKLPIHAECAKPVFSILDPEYTFSVPKYQTAAGCVDIMSHVFEQYFSPSSNAYVTDMLCEGILKTIVKYGPVAYEQPENYIARANIMWAGTIGLNGLLSCGKMTDWASHLIEHEVSAIYDLTHGAGLAIITPAWMRHVLDNYNSYKFCEIGKNVFGLTGNDGIDLANRSIDKIEEFFKKLNMPVRLCEADIDNSRIEEMAEKINSRFGKIGGFKQLDKNDVLAILNSCL
ncbi:MAG: iron-containing alcohol dehydrogenase [Candidatus Muirbacterium halophilum]|nr:iron-containing alcohol dehydrogenase [Candidatus Muirbacterium halophilum]MCK9476653.1 iron-containing alcohol dehydrogenase [Candidatus Muirbacterium halophilum]